MAMERRGKQMEKVSRKREEQKAWDNGALLAKVFDAQEPEPLPDDFTLSGLKKATRHMLSTYPPDDPMWRVSEHPPMLSDSLATFAASFVREGVEVWGETDGASALIRARIGLLEGLAHERTSINEALDFADVYIRDQVIELLGVHAFMETSVAYQLGKRSPLYAERLDLQGTMAKLHELEARKKDPLAAGFVEIDPASWRGRIFHDLCQLRWEEGALSSAVKVVTIFTLERQMRGASELVLSHDSFMARIRLGVSKSLIARRQLVAVPTMLFSLPAHSYLLYRFALAVERETIDQLEQQQREHGDPFVIAPKETRGRVVQEKDSSGALQQELVFLNTQTAGPKARNKAYFSLALGKRDDEERAGEDNRALAETPSLIEMLVCGLEELGVPARVLEHVPRVTAGFFAAAQIDLTLGEGSEAFGAWNTIGGSFWDTESGARICRIVGFDPKNKRHLERVVQIRNLLAQIRLHHIEEKGDKSTRVLFHDTLIEPRSARVEIEHIKEHGFSSHHSFHAFTLNATLWQLTRAQGGLTRFMVIDPRAFSLDASSSIAFNLYWVIVNRAYLNRHNAQRRVDIHGTFLLKLSTLLSFAGYFPEDERPARSIKRLEESLDLMVKEGLLCSWSADLQKKHTRASLERLILKVTFDGRSLEYFNKESLGANHPGNILAAPD